MDAAAAKWRNSGDIFPYVAGVGGDPWDCSPRAWAIVVCVKNFWDSDPAIATADPFYFNAGACCGIQSKHIMGCVVTIRANTAAWNDLTRLRIATTHELGHCLGLGHTNFANSVMRQASQFEFPIKHDWDVLWDPMYGTHSHPW